MNFLEGKKILITGAAGSIGSALVRRVALQKPKEIFCLDNNESDLFNLCEEIKKTKLILGSIRDEEWIRKIFVKYKPEIVFHCGAYKHVVILEKYPLEAIKTNLGGTLNLVSEAIRNGVEKFIFISTDKAVNPVSVMGYSKKMGEKLCLSLNGITKTKFIVVRFGNVLSSRGSVVEIWNRQIAERKPLTVTDKKMKRFTMGIYEAVELVLDAARMGRGGERFIFNMGEQIKIEDLARMMIKLSGKDLSLKYIGAKKGEKFYEELFTKEERSKAIKKDKLWLIG